MMPTERLMEGSHAAMPAAVFPIIMARHYGGHAPTALRIVIGTTVIGLLTIPLWIKLGLWFIEYVASKA